MGLRIVNYTRWDEQEQFHGIKGIFDEGWLDQICTENRDDEE